MHVPPARASAPTDWRIRAVLALLVAVPAFAAAPAVPASAAAPSPAPDLIVVGGVIRTEDRGDTVAAALAVRDGRVLAVGDDAEIRALAGKHTRIIDLHGRTATPGLIDTHAHLAGGSADALLSLDLSKATSIADVRRLVAARAATLKPGEWLTGSGWDEGKLAERRYIRASDLDDLVPRNPVWLDHTTGHYGVANTVALKLAGIDASRPDPPAGTIDRDANGRPTGVVKEAARDLVVAVLPELTQAQWRRAILAGVQLMHSEGMTGVKDPDLTAAQWDAYASLAREGKLHAHVCALWHSEPSLEKARILAAGAAALPRPPAAVAPNLVLCGIKIYMDGSGGARTAWMYQDWHKNSVDVDTGNQGYPALDPALYRQLVHLYHDAGLNIGTHAIGDRAIDWVVDSYREAEAANPKPGLRHSIIHANTPTDHALSVMAELQQTYDAGYPETQAEFAWWIGDNYAGNLGAERAARLNPYATYVKRGIRFGGGSDYDVTPLPARYGLWASVARTTLRGTYGAQPFGTAESISAADALRSYTTWAAHQLFLDAEAGSLEPGKSADLAVWDQDPVTAPTAALKDLHCELTVFRGKVVYRAPGGLVSMN
jgi:predicted amidohydrolase YtcJ